MKLIKISNDDSFDPTPKLKSSPVPISFVSFNADDRNCIHCGNTYAITTSYQYYCKKCLSCYLANITDNNLYLDVTNKLYYSKHEINMTKKPQNIQECHIFCFKQIPNDRNDMYYSGNYSIERRYFAESFEKYCRQCGKTYSNNNTIYDKDEFKLCTDCYLFSSECIESTLTKKRITVLYFPCWLNISRCKSCCKMLLKFTSDCQKYCENCFTFYIGCRYCLTTNIIFGITNQSQCKKCKRVSFIIFDNSGNSYLDDVLANSRRVIYNQLNLTEYTDWILYIDNYFVPYESFHSIYERFYHSSDKAEILMEWIPYSQFTNVKEIARGGFGIIYLSTWLDGPFMDNDGISKSRMRYNNETVILKKFINSQGISKYFLNELESSQCCRKFNRNIIKIYGFTRDPKFDNYILVMQYASGGDLHNWIQKNFTKITWNKKLDTLWKISEGLEIIHHADYTHRDFHSGNILCEPNNNNYNNNKWIIADLGLAQPANNTSNNEIYGVIPYIAPEIFKGSSFSKESDVYSMGMIMWELTTGCKPFANVEHDVNLILKILDGKRPEITEDTPECFANLMKNCWNPDPKERPCIKDIHDTLVSWYLLGKNIEQFDQAEIKRAELIGSKKLGPEFSEVPHPKAIYTSRSLSPYISECSSISSIYSSKDLIHLYVFYIPTIKTKFTTSRSNEQKIEEININSNGNSGKSIKISSSSSKTSLTDRIKIENNNEVNL
ncbi:kinase-like protein [Rhizophagus irregularis]|nr:kinase-like protein [Rhizophagus irregularis]